MSYLEQYIRDNRAAFDSGELPEGSNERFLNKLQRVQEETVDKEKSVWMNKIDKDPKVVSIGKKTAVGYIFASVATVAAVFLISFFLDSKSDSVNGINGLQMVESMTVAEYILLMNTLDEEIVQMSKRCDEKTAKEAVKASKSIKNDAVPLEEQLPEELSERERAEILRRYYKEKAEGLKKVKTFLAVQMMEEE